MSDPERLLSGSGAKHGLEREVLGSLRVVTVPAEAKGLVWGALGSHALHAAALAGSTAAPLSFWRAAFKLAASSKATLAVPIVVAALTAGAVKQRLTPSPVVPAVSAAAAPAAPAPHEASPAEPQAAEPALQPAERPASLAPHKDRLARESALLTRARAELRAGNPAAAQNTLARLQKEFGSGALYQEREVLAIEALAAQGNASSAARLANAFIAQHPESPHVPALRRFVAR